MSYYYSVRGWLEADEEEFKRATVLLKEVQKREADANFALYSTGWCWNEAPVNWTRYIFYGADVKREGLDRFIEIIKEIARGLPDLEGCFFVKGEDGRNAIVYKVGGGSVEEEAASPEFY